MENLDALIAQADSIGLSGHIRPDGDCVGSTLAVYNYIKNNYPNKKVRLFLEPIPTIFMFLQRSQEIISDYPKMEEFDLFITLDCGDLGRIGEASKYFLDAKHTACIDHHISNQAFAEDNYIFPDASSTCELVYELLDKEKLTKEIAECLYTGMVHDTGVFQYSCTSHKTMDIAGALMDKGIDYPKIVDETFYTKKFEQNKILGQALLNSKLYSNGRVIVSVISQEEMKKYGVLPKHLDGIVNQLRITKGITVALFLYELAPSSYKGSMRVCGEFDVAKIAMQFGGGGHVKAAGFEIEGQIDEIIDRVVTVIEKDL